MHLFSTETSNVVAASVFRVEFVEDEYRNKYVGSLSYLNIVHIYT